MSEFIKRTIQTQATQLIETHLKPKHIQKPEPSSNYLTDISGKWSRGYFYFSSTYTCPEANALSPTFESKFARMEFLGNDQFALSSFRHTDKWQEIYPCLTAEECFQSIQDDPWFQP